MSCSQRLPQNAPINFINITFSIIISSFFYVSFSSTSFLFSFLLVLFQRFKPAQPSVLPPSPPHRCPRFVSQANVETHANVHKAWVTRKQNRLKGIVKTPKKPKSTSNNIPGENQEDSNSEIEKGPCEVCGKLVNVDKMKQHINDCHLREEKFNCNDCDRIFDRKDRLRNHRLIKHIKRELKCIFCHKIYYSRKVLTAHVKGVHEKVRHQCPMCERSYSQRPDLLVHIKGVHEGKRSLCAICGKEFIRASEKNRHERQVHNFIQKPSESQPRVPSLLSSSSLPPTLPQLSDLPHAAMPPMAPLPLLPPPPPHEQNDDGGLLPIHFAV